MNEAVDVTSGRTGFKSAPVKVNVEASWRQPEFIVSPLLNYLLFHGIVLVQDLRDPPSLTFLSQHFFSGGWGGKKGGRGKAQISYGIVRFSFLTFSK